MGSTDKMFKGGLPTLLLSGSMDSVNPAAAANFSVTGTVTNWPSGSGSHSFVVVIDDEAILCSARSNTTFTVEQRGYDGTTAAAHSNGADVKHELDAASVLAHEQHVVKTTAAHAATAVSVVPAGNIASTTAQAALEELDAALDDKLDLAGGTLSGALNAADQLVSRALLKDYGEEVMAHGATGATEALNMNDGNVHSITLDANCTLTFTNPTATGDACSFTLIVTQDGTGSRLITWPASVKWAGGVPPTLSTAAGKVDLLAFVTVDGGTTWYGFVGGKAFA